MLKIGMIGFGGIGHSHFPAWEELGDYAKVVAVADIRDEKTDELKDRDDITTYKDGYDLLKNADVDIIDICLPTYLHTKYAVAAMEKGCDVFLEKPVCLNEEEAQLLLATQKKTGAKVQIGQVVRFKPAYNWVKEAIENETYGKIVSAQFARLSPRSKWSWNNWMNDSEKSGSVVLDLHIHDVDFIRYMMGKEPDSFTAHATRNKGGEIREIFTTYKFGDVPVSAIGSWEFNDKFPFSPSFVINFEKAGVVHNGGNNVKVYTDEEAFETDIKLEMDKVVDGGINIKAIGSFYDELKWFVTETIPNGKNKASLEDAINSARLAWKEIEYVGGKVIK